MRRCASRSKRSSRLNVQALTRIKSGAGRLSVLPQDETVSQCHPEAEAEGSRFRK